MSTPPDDGWNPDDGPPPTAEERAESARLAAAIEHPARLRDAGADGDLVPLVATALRVRATVHPDHDAARAVAARVVTETLARSRGGLGAWWSRPRARWGFAAAAAAVIATVTVGGRELSRARPPRPTETISRTADDVFHAPVEMGAGSAPASRIFDSRLRSYREVYLRGRQP